LRISTADADVREDLRAAGAIFQELVTGTEVEVPQPYWRCDLAEAIAVSALCKLDLRDADAADEHAAAFDSFDRAIDDGDPAAIRSLVHRMRERLAAFHALDARAGSLFEKAMGRLETEHGAGRWTEALRAQAVDALRDLRHQVAAGWQAADPKWFDRLEYLVAEGTMEFRGGGWAPSGPEKAR
jgi:hypothetical protein